jgi:hypothetical protein
MNIQLLYFDGCPSWQAGLKNLEAALQELQIAARPELFKVRDDAEASHLEFLGSPSFLINGQDLWPEKRASYALSCRVYATPSGIQGAPTLEMLKEKITLVLKG